MERVRPKSNGAKPASGRRKVGRPRVRAIERKWPKGTKDKGGRPRGSPNKISERIRAQHAATGELPHEFALRVMRLGVGAKLLNGHREETHTITWEDVQWATQLAAPYFAARMASIRLSGHDGGPMKVFHIDPEKLASMSPEQLLVLELALGDLMGKPQMNGHAMLEDKRTDAVEVTDYERMVNQ